MNILIKVAGAALAIMALAGCQTAGTTQSASSSFAGSFKSDKKTKAALNKKASAKSSKKTPYEKLIRAHAKANGVPYNLARAVVSVESNFRANARGAAGEVGLMQIKPATARGMGYRGSRKALYNPSNNIKYGMRYLGKAHKLAGGSICGTILRYNAGHGAKRMNPISARYCKKVKQRL